MKLYLYITLSIVVFFQTSCTDKIDIDLPDPEPVLVVDGFISDIDTTQWLKLSSLENYFAEGNPDFTIYKNAKVKLLENGVEVGNYIFVDSTGQFELKYQGINGRVYQIDILLPDGKHYISVEETMETVPKIDSMWFVNNINNENASAFSADFAVNINTQESPGYGDSYQWKAFVNGDYQNKPENLNFSNDQFVEGQYVQNLEIFGLSKEEFDSVKTEAPDNRVWVTIEQSKISNRYYDFLYLVFQQTLFVGGPFATPPAEIRGNVYLQGGNEELALGYFYTASIHSKTIEIFE